MPDCIVFFTERYGKNEIQLDLITTSNLHKVRDRSVANEVHIIICSICASFSVARFVISGGYHRGSVESVNESIVR